jgi:hypothetical protein
LHLVAFLIHHYKVQSGGASVTLDLVDVGDSAEEQPVVLIRAQIFNEGFHQRFGLLLDLLCFDSVLSGGFWGLGLVLVLLKDQFSLLGLDVVRRGVHWQLGSQVDRRIIVGSFAIVGG